ncbi:threonine aldolase [Balamuthia mandrillaris]
MEGDWTEYVDLRSDTVTHPTPEMREAMATAKVGDDVFGDDPTVLQLQEECARLFGKEAALFVPSGTQGNLIALLTHCNRGEEVIVGDLAHIFLFEAAGMSAVGGLMPRTLPVRPDGTIALEDIEAAIRTKDDHFPTTRLICLENTQNKAGGVALPPEYISAVCALAKRHSLAVHMDGARIFNAFASYPPSSSLSLASLVADVDSITICLSKGLCAPVGSVLLGTRSFIQRARRIRKMLGGGMRQAGVLAAAGLLAIGEEMRGRVKEDQERAEAIAEGIRGSEVLKPYMQVVKNATNFVFLKFLGHKDQTQEQNEKDGSLLVRRLRENHKIILIDNTNHNNFRLVTHYWIKPEHVQRIISAFEAEVSHLYPN